jgi:hypothetical protein
MTEAPSNTIFVVGDRLPWPDDSSPVHEKGAFESGVLIDSGLRTPCSIRKISTLGATLLTDQKKAAGSQVAVELGNGQRPAATVDWADRRELGVRFSEPVDVIALINRSLVSQPVERRSMPRVELRCPVHVKYGEHFEPATMRNISARGLQVEGQRLPPAGTYIAVFVEGLNIPAGEVVWSRDNLAGIEVFEELNWTSIIPWVRDAIRKGVNSN